MAVKTTATASRAVDTYLVLAWMSFGLVLLVVGLSAYMRLKAIGYGCTPWPACYGREGLATGLDWTSRAHRVAASGVALMILAINGVALKRAEPARRLAALAMLVLTGFLASWGVLHGDARAPGVALANLLGGFLLLMCAAWACRVGGGHRAGAGGWPVRPMMGLVAFAAAASGAVAAVQEAALACVGPDGCSPWRFSDWWTGLQLALSTQIGEASSAARSALLSTHAAMGWFTLAVICLGLAWSWRRQPAGGLLPVAALVATAVATGWGLAGGSGNVVVALVHNLSAALLLAGLVGLGRRPARPLPA